MSVWYLQSIWLLLQSKKQLMVLFSENPPNFLSTVHEVCLLGAAANSAVLGVRRGIVRQARLWVASHLWVIWAFLILTATEDNGHFRSPAYVILAALYVATRSLLDKSLNTLAQHSVLLLFFFFGHHLPLLRHSAHPSPSEHYSSLRFNFIAWFVPRQFQSG